MPVLICDTTLEKLNRHNVRAGLRAIRSSASLGFPLRPRTRPLLLPTLLRIPVRNLGPSQAVNEVSRKLGAHLALIRLPLWLTGPNPVLVNCRHRAGWEVNSRASDAQLHAREP